MNRPLEFWFDFSSPYGFLASERIEALAARHGRTVDWHPMLLGVAFKQTGTQPLTRFRSRATTRGTIFARTARFHGIEFRMPTRFPIPSQAPAASSRGQRRAQPAACGPVVRALYRAYFVDDRDISDPEVAADVAAEAGVDRAAARAAMDDPAVKDAFRRDVDAAIAAACSARRSSFVDGEPFWGLDRFDQIERWLATGGF